MRMTVPSVTAALVQRVQLADGAQRPRIEPSGSLTMAAADSGEVARGVPDLGSVLECTEEFQFLIGCSWRPPSSVRAASDIGRVESGEEALGDRGERSSRGRRDRAARGRGRTKGEEPCPLPLMPCRRPRERALRPARSRLPPQRLAAQGQVQFATKARSPVSSAPVGRGLGDRRRVPSSMTPTARSGLRPGEPGGRGRRAVRPSGRARRPSRILREAVMTVAVGRRAHPLNHEPEGARKKREGMLAGNRRRAARRGPDDRGRIAALLDGSPQRRGTAPARR